MFFWAESQKQSFTWSSKFSTAMTNEKTIANENVALGRTSFFHMPFLPQCVRFHTATRVFFIQLCFIIRDGCSYRSSYASEANSCFSHGDSDGHVGVSFLCYFQSMYSLANQNGWTFAQSIVGVMFSIPSKGFDIFAQRFHHNNNTLRKQKQPTGHWMTLQQRKRPSINFSILNKWNTKLICLRWFWIELNLHYLTSRQSHEGMKLKMSHKLHVIQRRLILVVYHLIINKRTSFLCLEF